MEDEEYFGDHVGFYITQGAERPELPVILQQQNEG